MRHKTLLQPRGGMIAFIVLICLVLTVNFASGQSIKFTDNIVRIVAPSRTAQTNKFASDASLKKAASSDTIEFTGDAYFDFASGPNIPPGVYVVKDPPGIGDVGLPTGARDGTISGWDMDAVYFYYDHKTDMMQVGFDFGGRDDPEAVCGDADGDHKQDHTDGWLADLGGHDNPFLEGSESVVLLIDTNNDGDAEVAVGVGNEQDIDAFAAYKRKEDGFLLPFYTQWWIAPLPNNVVTFHHQKHNTHRYPVRDLEFTMRNFSKLPNFSFTPGQSFEFGMLAFAGSLNDDGIGEEFVPHDLGGIAGIAYDFGDAPSPYPTLTAGNGAFHLIIPDLRLGEKVDRDTDGQSTDKADGDDNNGDDDEDGVTIPELGFAEGSKPSIPVIVRNKTGKTAMITGWIDYDGDKQWEPEEKAETIISGSGSVKLKFPTVPLNSYDLTRGITFARFRISTNLECIDKPYGFASDGEVEDYLVKIYEPASLGDTVWVDKNGNGIQDDDHSGLDSVRVNLLDSNGNPEKTTVTKNGGFYSFEGLAPGDYIVEFVKPEGYKFTEPHRGSDFIDSDVIDPVKGWTDTIVLVSGQVVDTVDAGLYKLASIGDFVWEDMNYNGIQDTEPGIKDVTVNLLDSLGKQIPGKTFITGQDGKYHFDTLDPATYIVEFIPPDDSYFFTFPDSGDDTSKDSDANPKTKCTPPITLESGQKADTVDAGLYRKVSIGDFVWLDKDGDGLQIDVNELGIEGVTVSLLDSMRNPIAGKKDTTDNEGKYSFNYLEPGKYFVEFDTLEGFKFTSQDQGADDTIDSDVDPNTGVAGPIVLVSGEKDTTIDAGLFQSASIGDFVWLDRDGDGLQIDGNELGIKGVTVSLLDSMRNPIAGKTDMTDSEGKYSFEGINPGKYFVKFEPRDAYKFTLQHAGKPELDSDADSTGLAGPILLTSGEKDTTIDAGLFQPASIGDWVWLDEDGLGLQDQDEQGIGNVTINLLDSSGTQILRTTTSDSGNSVSKGKYHFYNLNPGKYIVEFVKPDSRIYKFTLPNQGDDASDSDADTTTGRTETITLVSGEFDSTVDAGLYELASIGDFVWEDMNYNGIQDTEPGIENVTVNLLDSLGKQIPGKTFITGQDGKYHFDALDPATYIVEFVPPDDSYFFTLPDQGDDCAKDSDADPITGHTPPITLESGQKADTVDAGLYRLASIGNWVWQDMNGDGKQNASEPGTDTVIVKLFNSQDSLISEEITQNRGFYKFDSLLPGDYFVKFEPDTSVYKFTLPNQGDDMKDSDADTATGKTDRITLVSGEKDTTIDAGLFQSASIGDFVWLDNDGDGLQENDVSGIDTVHVNLLDSTGIQILRTTTTDNEGKYSFEGINPGKYFVKFDPRDGYKFTLQHAGKPELDSDADSTGLAGPILLTSGETDTTIDAGLYQPASIGDFVWEDSNHDGIQDAGEPVIKEDVTVKLLWEQDTLQTTVTDDSGRYLFKNLRPGDYKVKFFKPKGFLFTLKEQGDDSTKDSNADTTGCTETITLVSGEFDNTIDAGLYRLTTIGDLVWEDMNYDGIQETTNEPGINDVTVNLFTLDSLGNWIPDTTTTTDSAGKYRFENLEPGAYTVEFIKPEKYHVTWYKKGADRDKDSDADPNSLRTAPVTLVSGQKDTTIDAGFFRKASIGDYVWRDKNGDGIQNAKEWGINNIRVNLLDSTGNQISGQTTKTEIKGKYKFENLNPGKYIVEFVLCREYNFTLPDQGTDDAKDSDANPATGRTPIIKLVSGQFADTVDAGLFRKASIGDFVWMDKNANGIQDACEPGIKNVTVKLLDGEGHTIPGKTTTTSCVGKYIFSNLDPGEYSVKFIAPSGYQFTTPNQGTDDSKDSDADPNSGRTASFTLHSDESNYTIDAGLINKASIGDFVWLDKNGNGIQDKCEPGIKNVPVNLLDGQGNPISGKTTITDKCGKYKFENLNPGQYIVEFVKPDGYKFTLQDQGTNDAKDSDADPTTGRTALITLNSGQYNSKIDAGFYKTACIGDFVWNDRNGNVSLDKGEPGIKDIAVYLLDEQGNRISGKSTKTDQQGFYQFTELIPAAYQVEFVNPDTTVYKFNFQNQGDSTKNPNTILAPERIIPIKLSSGELNKTIDAGLVASSIGGLVRFDRNRDGILDTTGVEEGIAGMLVNLINKQDTVKTTITDSSGFYSFRYLPQGEYIIEFDLPKGLYRFSPKDKCPDDRMDSDINPLSDRTDTIVISAGEIINTIDAGLIRKGNAIVLSSLTADIENGEVSIFWMTKNESYGKSYNIYRSRIDSADYIKLNKTLIPNEGDATKGASYSYIDQPEDAGKYYYKIEDISVDGYSTFHGPISVTFATSVEMSAKIPLKYDLLQNYPNPFNPETHIKYALSKNSYVTIDVFDIQGKLVRNLVAEDKQAGIYEVIWDSKNNYGNSVANATYFYRMKAAKFIKIRKMILLK